MNQGIKEIVTLQTKFFRRGTTRDINYRKQMLTKLEEGIRGHEDDLYEAFQEDLGKSKAESYMTEIAQVLGELAYIRKHIGKWARSKKVQTTSGTFPGKSRVYMEPYGTVLVLAPWNYPVFLAFSPVIGAIAAGNTVVLKCSKSSPNCARVIREIIIESLPTELCYPAPAEIDYDEILDQDYQYIFFTGSPRVGKQIMGTASKRLIPVSLELGGKSPCIVTDSANIKLAAKRIIWGKLLNSGQTCISIDYILVDRKVKDALVSELKEEIDRTYGSPLENIDYPKIVSDHHFNRLMNLIEEERKLGNVIGGNGDAKLRKIEPAIVTDADFTHPSMEEEIFGPILPVIAYDNLNDAVEEINDRPHPLATYIFTEDSTLAKSLITKLPFGGGCINDTILHIANHHMPFGGVGNSGMGNYHGYYSFRTFTHEKSVYWGSTKIDIPIRYGPLDDKKWNFLKRFI